MKQPWLLSLIALGCLAAAQWVGADEKPQVVGNWKLVSFEIEFQDTGERWAIFGKRPVGFLVFTAEGRMMAHLEAERRAVPRSFEERVAAYETLIAYSGKYRQEHDRVTVRIDAASDAAWLGSEQTRYYRLDGDRLLVRSDWARSPGDDHISAPPSDRIIRSQLVWQREGGDTYEALVPLRPPAPFSPPPCRCAARDDAALAGRLPVAR
ncbi:MAG TPA: lipocalin-like domain-containing protein [Burkholderiaceae bacterium]|nr:lipocalin-like domain-containing protein [Burkholderiaceae bacterium]